MVRRSGCVGHGCARERWQDCVCPPRVRCAFGAAQHSLDLHPTRTLLAGLFCLLVCSFAPSAVAQEKKAKQAEEDIQQLTLERLVRILGRQ